MTHARGYERPVDGGSKLRWEEAPNNGSYSGVEKQSIAPGREGMPGTVLVDREDRIAISKAVDVSLVILEAYINALLAE